jgi:hypothetical protein
MTRRVRIPYALCPGAAAAGTTATVVEEAVHLLRYLLSRRHRLSPCFGWRARQLAPRCPRPVARLSGSRRRSRYLRPPPAQGPQARAPKAKKRRRGLKRARGRGRYGRGGPAAEERKRLKCERRQERPAARGRPGRQS